MDNININIDTDLISTLFDKEKRKYIIENPKEYAQSLGMDVDGKEVVVVVSGKNIIYIPVHEVNTEMSSAELGEIRAAGSASTGGTAGSIGSIGTVSGTVSTVGSVSSVGTAGSAGGD